MTDLRKIRLLHEATDLPLTICLRIVKNIIPEDIAQYIIDEGIEGIQSLEYFTSTI